MSEQQPLLSERQQDVEYGNGGEDYQKSVVARWREHTAETLESRPWHYAVILMVVTDTVCVLADLAYTLLSDTCTPVEGPDAPIWLNVLSHLSLGITTLFLVEIPVTLWAMGLGYYNPFGTFPHAGLHLFDSVVIVATFVFEVILRGRERELAGLLIILRLWRLVKLVGGIAVSTGEMEEETVKELAETRTKLNKALQDLQATRDENSKLRARVAWTDDRGGDGATTAGTYTKNYTPQQSE